MKHTPAVLGLVLALAAGAGAARAVDETKPYGLACAMIVDPKTNKEALPGGGIDAHSGHLLTVHLDANADGEAFVVALTRKEHRLAHGWRPEIVPLKEWSEMAVPAASGKWEWTKAEEAFDVFVVFFPRDSEAAAEARKLVVALREPGADEKTLATHARSLRDELRKWQQDDALLARQPVGGPASIAGSVRTVGDFPWRDFARKANFDVNKPAVLVFPHAAGK